MEHFNIAKDPNSQEINISFFIFWFGTPKIRQYFLTSFASCLHTVNLSSDVLDKLNIYRINFEKAYIEATDEFYRAQAAAYLQENGVQNYMRYVSAVFTRLTAALKQALPLNKRRTCPLESRNINKCRPRISAARMMGSLFE